MAVNAVAETPAYERPPSMLYGWGLARLSVLELAEACLRDSQESYARVEKEMSEIVKEKKQLQDQVKVSEDKIRGLTAESIPFFLNAKSVFPIQRARHWKLFQSVRGSLISTGLSRIPLISSDEYSSPQHRCMSAAYWKELVFP